MPSRIRRLPLSKPQHSLTLQSSTSSVQRQQKLPADDSSDLRLGGCGHPHSPLPTTVRSSSSPSPHARISPSAVPATSGRRACVSSLTPSTSWSIAGKSANGTAARGSSRTPSDGSRPSGASRPMSSTRATTPAISTTRSPRRTRRRPTSGREAGSASRPRSPSNPSSAAGCTCSRRATTGPTCAASRRSAGRGPYSRRTRP